MSSKAKRLRHVWFPEELFLFSCYNFHLLFFQLPTVVSVVNHLLGHATVNADVLTRNETCLVAAKEQHHIGNVHWIADSAGRLLRGIGTFVNGVCRIYPTRGNGIYSCLSCQASSIFIFLSYSAKSHFFKHLSLNTIKFFLEHPVHSSIH